MDMYTHTERLFSLHKDAFVPILDAAQEALAPLPVQGAGQGAGLHVPLIYQNHLCALHLHTGGAPRGKGEASSSALSLIA